MKITTKTTREQLAAIIVKKLKEHKISVVLVGGAVVSIYTRNDYPSRDLDFISAADHDAITAAMEELGFEPKGKDFIHPKSEFTVEFPPAPLALGNDEPVKAEGKMKVNGVTITMLSPTQAAMDRLVWFYSNRDRQCLDQAIMIAKAQDVNLAKIREWSKREGALEQYEIFVKRLKS